MSNRGPYAKSLLWTIEYAELFRIMYPYMPNDMMINLLRSVGCKATLTNATMLIRAKTLGIRKQLSDLGAKDLDELDEHYADAIAMYSDVHDIMLTRNDIMFDEVVVTD